MSCCCNACHHLDGHETPRETAHCPWCDRETEILRVDLEGGGYVLTCRDCALRAAGREVDP